MIGVKSWATSKLQEPLEVGRLWHSFREEATNKHVSSTITDVDEHVTHVAP